MRTIQCGRAGVLAGVLGACLLVTGAARADVTTERPGSILIFPKVVSGGGRTTIIQIANTGNMLNTARCFYLNATPAESGQPVCTETDFEIALTRQQPTHFDVSTGRTMSAPLSNGIGNAGLFPGLIPPVAPGFVGALICVEVDTSDGPLAQDQLKGEATIVGPGADESKYNAIAVQGATTGTAGDNDLSLDNSEYNACPATNIANIIPAGATDPIITDEIGNSGVCTNSAIPCRVSTDCPSFPTQTCTTGLSRVATALSLVPCSLDLDSGIPTTVTVNVVAFDEFERRASAGFTFSCVGNIDLSTVLDSLSFGATPASFAQVQLTAAPGSSPFVGVAEATHVDSIGNAAAAATNLHVLGTGPDSLIRLPAAQ